MKGLMLGLLLLASLSCACWSQTTSCGMVMHVSGQGNLCPCGSMHEAFVAGGQSGEDAELGGCTSGSCQNWLVFASCDLDAASDPVDTQLVKLAVPRELLVSSCGGGLRPFKLPAEWFAPEEPMRPRSRSEIKEIKQLERVGG